MMSKWFGSKKKENNNDDTKVSSNKTISTSTFTSSSGTSRTTTETTSYRYSRSASGSSSSINNNVSTVKTKTGSTGSLPKLSTLQVPALPAPVPRYAITYDAKKVGQSSPINSNFENLYKGTPSMYSSLRKPQKTTTSLPLHKSQSFNTSREKLPKTTTTNPSVKVPKDKKIVVIKSKTLLGPDYTKVPTYITRSRKRGKILIINNIMFSENAERKGAENDHRNLRSLFEQMGFNVIVEKNLKRDAMKKEIKNFRNTLRDIDISIVVCMSHGTKSENARGNTEIYGSDDKPLLIEDILENFTPENCPKMEGKPKIFIFQCCRGDNMYFTMEHDAVPLKKKIGTDILIAYSTLPGFASARLIASGTVYIQQLCETFGQRAHEICVESLLKIVNHKLELASKYPQTSTYECRGFKRCFLNPM